MRSRRINLALFWLLIVLFLTCAGAEWYFLLTAIHSTMHGDAMHAFDSLFAAIIILIPLGGTGYGLYRILR